MRLVVVLLLACLNVFAQDTSKPTTTFFGHLAFGGSQFRTDIPSPSSFASMEFRIGPGVRLAFNNLFEFESRLLFGSKLKREAANKNGVVTIGPPFMRLDEVSSSRNHAFYEVPVLLRYRIKHPGFALSTGLNYRSFMPNNDDVDFLTARKELQLLAGISISFENGIEIGIEYYFGLTSVYGYSGPVDGEEVDMSVYNNSAMIYYAYTFKRRK